MAGIRCIPPRWRDLWSEVGVSIAIQSLKKNTDFLHLYSEPKLYIVVWAGKYGQTRVCREEKEEGDV